MEVFNGNFTNGTDKEDTSDGFDKTFFVARVTVMSVWTLLVLVPNCLVLFVLLFKSNLRKNYRTEFILWLCISDIMIGMTSAMYLLTTVISSLAASPSFCCLILFSVYSGVTQSLAHTFLLCYERYLAIVRKIKFQVFSKRSKYFLIVGSWVTVNLYIGIMAACFLRVDKIEYCGIEAFPNGKYYMICGSIVCLPLLILTLSFYISFTVKLKSHVKKIHVQPSTSQPARNTTVDRANDGREEAAVPQTTTEVVKQPVKLNEREITITIGAIAIALFLSTGPFVVTKVLEGLSLVKFSRVFKVCISFLAGSNAILNPLFYAWRLPAFRKEIRNIFAKQT